MLRKMKVIQNKILRKGRMAYMKLYHTQRLKDTDCRRRDKEISQ